MLWKQIHRACVETVSTPLFGGLDIRPMRNILLVFIFFNCEALVLRRGQAMEYKDIIWYHFPKTGFPLFLLFSMLVRRDIDEIIII
jgi:hypothetical protein